MRFFRERCSITKILITFILFLLIAFFIFHKTITPIFFSIAEAEARKIANKAINQAVSEEAEAIEYGDMVKFTYNEKKDSILLMQPNIKYINNFTSEISLNIQRRLEKCSRKNVSVPLARIFGIEVLAGFGPELEARIVPLGFTEPPVVLDSFTSAGINQTRHKIYLKVMVQLKLIVPFSSRLINVTADVPVTEVVILGRVPNVYIGVEGEQLKGIIDYQGGNK